MFENEENEAVVSLVQAQFKPHSVITKNHFSQTDSVVYRAEWGRVYWVRFAPRWYCNFNKAGEGATQVMIDLVDEEHLVINSNVGAYLAPRPSTDNKSGFCHSLAYVCDFSEAPASKVERLIDKAFKLLAQDIARRTLIGVAERLRNKSLGFAALKKAVALKNELEA